MQLFHYIIQGFVTNELANNDYDLEIEKGLSIPIPGELILWVFGWAEWDEEDFEFVAPWKWWYCIFAVSMFLIGIEVGTALSRISVGGYIALTILLFINLFR